MTKHLSLLPQHSPLARWRMANATAAITATGWTPLAALSCGGIIARCDETGRLAEHFGDHIANIDQRAAQHAIDRLQHTAQTVNTTNGANRE